mmetsp:Transcript_25767/g.29457  ORF Transcript_25767/g.29457 Transcript_25767/m.29457 type:complete len:236 (+) Transcript_25767:33-740(+)|eukprot:CAMPEP_0194170178 /NCGR_PEP_ID=MMETSP0154-20130528/4830_1 /TAXON_ID=1049557 /ORGANISM="Thalassiothrix antarctica, Strain L6-D1" /LENGTH=235 /DNA_ID=CAMNT_0038881913 /DNA_START=27 /DNA_END=734 /DNA_ORIENTATION=-
MIKPRPLKQESGLSIESDAPSVLHSAIQRESVDFDRREIRRKIVEKLKERGEDEEIGTTLLNDDFDDEETIYEDTEIFPWKQREAAVQAAALGGKTEGRMEGYDSLERALQAHAHQLVYGRGRGFGWSSQHKTDSGPPLLLQQHKLESMQHLSDWSGSTNSRVRDVDKMQTDGSGPGNPAVLAERDIKEARKRARFYRLLNWTYVLVAILMFLVFAYYIESLKLSTYEVYVPAND